MKLLLSFLLLAIAAMVWGAQPRPEEVLVHSRIEALAVLSEQVYSMPASEKPRVIWDYADKASHSGWADCRAWTLRLHHRTAIDNPLAMFSLVLPHEYAHFVHCFLYGGTVGWDPHNARWQVIVAELGGDPNFK